MLESPQFLAASSSPLAAATGSCEYAGLGKSLNTFAVSFVIVAVGYTHPRYLVLAPHPDFGGSEQPPALPPLVDPEASFGPSKGGHSPREGGDLKEQDFCKNLIEVLAYW